MTAKSKGFTMYLVIGVIFVVAVVAAVAVHRRAKSNAAAQAKADQLIVSLQNDGMATPTRAQIVGVLGDDGGPVCADPGSALKRAIESGQLTTGAGGPGQRPVRATVQAVRGGLKIIQIYCPEQLPTVQDFVKQLNLSGTGE